jgi:hypothetical protein
MPNFPTAQARAVARDESLQITRGKRRPMAGKAFPGDSRLRLLGRPGSLATLGQREKKYDLMTKPAAVHGTMAAVTAAKRSLRIALVARRHIDLKRVCSCCCRCLP